MRRGRDRVVSSPPPVKEPIPSRPTLRTLVLAVALVGAQAFVFASAQVDEFAAARRGRRWFTGPVQERDLSFLSVAAQRSLSGIDAELPSDARVLLVSLSPFLAPYDFYLAPRTLRVLIHVDEQLGERAIGRFPQSAGQARRYLRQIEQRGQRLTPEHLHEALLDCDWLIVFMGALEALPLGEDAPRLVPVTRHEQAALFRVERAP
jgi:hypothetical protein